MEDDSDLELAIDACADRLAFLNEAFSTLATETSLSGVELWRQCRTRRPIQAPQEEESKSKQPAIDLQSIAIELLKQNTLEDVLDLLADDHNTEMSLTELVHLIGNQQYLIALKRDLNELLKNAISFEQIATLWNDLERPALGGPTWNSRTISLLAS